MPFLILLWPIIIILGILLFVALLVGFLRVFAIPLLILAVLFWFFNRQSIHRRYRNYSHRDDYSRHYDRSGRKSARNAHEDDHWSDF